LNHVVFLLSDPLEHQNKDDYVHLAEHFTIYTVVQIL